MPNDVIPRARRRRIAAFAAGALGAALLPAMVFSSSPVSAANPCVPDGYTATSSADLLKLNLLDLAPLGLVHSPIASVTIGHAASDMAHAHSQVATASADYLSASLAGLTVPSSLLHTHALQSAPPANPTADAHSLLALHTGLLNLGAGNVSAAAGANGTYSCDVAAGTASIADVAALPGPGGNSLLALPTELNGDAAAGLINSSGHLMAKAGANTGLAEIDLLTGTAAAMKIKVVTEPSLVGIAGGSTATSSVTYTSPVLDVTLPGGNHVTVDNAHADAVIATTADASAVTGMLSSLHLPVSPSLSALSLNKTQVEVHLSLGELTKSISPSSVSGSAATLRVHIMLAPVGTHTGLLSKVTGGGKTVLDLGIGELQVAATAPAETPAPCDNSYGCGSTPPCNTHGYGYGPGCGSPSPYPSHSTSPTPSPSKSTSPPKPTPSVSGTTIGKLPKTGSDTALYIGAGVLLLLVGRFMIVAARRRATE